MRVISKKTIETYYEAHPDCRGALLAWYERITATEWADFNHLKRGFPSVDFVGNNHYVFNIRGNSYRLVVVVQFVPQRALVRFIGTHAEYDKIKNIAFYRKVVAMKIVKLIKTEKENEKALREIEALMTKPKLTKAEDDYLELLFVLVENFEKKAYPLPKPTPQEMVQYLMDEFGYTKKDLEKQLGAPSRVSEFLNGKRKLTLNMIRNLHKNWGAPIEALI